jgi:hypothetical protein
VAVRGVTLAATGELVEASTAFAALRDNTTSNDNDVNNRRDHFAGIFDKLTVAGVDTAELQIAWDFTTMSKSGVSNRLVTMRDDAFNRTAEGVEYKIAQVVDDFSENIARKVEVYIKVPQYVNEVRPSKQLHLVLDADGVPQYQGDEWYAFTLLIPWSVFNDTAEDRSVLQYGHGLFYSRKEVESGYLQEQAQLHGYVMVASNWLGLSETDAPYIAEMLSSDLSKFQMVPDRCQQGVLLALLVMRTMQQGHIYSEAALADVNGKPILQANPDMYYTGNSCGGILGTVYMAASTDVQRAVIGVGGGPFSLLLPRSKDFELLFTDLKLRYAEPLARSFLFAWLQQLWIRADPAGYAGYVTKNTLPNTKKHTLVFQSGLGDAQVSVLGVYFLARSTDAVMFKSNVVFADTTLYGFDFVADDVTVNNASTAVTWQWSDVPEDPLHNFPANEEYDTHDNPRKDTNAQDMMYHFFNTGNTVNTCEGPCFVKV